MLLPGGFQKFAGIPPGISRIFESLMVQQISANRRKNRSIQVYIEWIVQFLKLVVDRGEKYVLTLKIIANYLKKC